MLALLIITIAVSRVPVFVAKNLLCSTGTGTGTLFLSIPGRYSRQIGVLPVEGSVPVLQLKLLVNGDRKIHGFGSEI